VDLLNTFIAIVAFITMGLTAYLVYYSRKDRKPRVDIKIMLGVSNPYSTTVTFILISHNLPFTVTEVGFKLSRKDTIFKPENPISNLDKIHLEIGEPHELEYTLEEIKEMVGSKSGWTIREFYIKNDFNQYYIQNKYYLTSSRKKDIKTLTKYGNICESAV